MPDSPTNIARSTDRRMELAREWDTLVEQVRQLPDFEDFLQPPRVESLLSAAAGGPIAIINVSHWRCDAVIVTVNGVQVVELRELDIESAVEWAQRYLQGLRDAEFANLEYHQARRRYDDGDQSYDARRAYTSARDSFVEVQHDREVMLEQITRWMWDVIAEPILTTLGLTDSPGNAEPWPRMWWCPTGPLALLPLHAAGDHKGGLGATVLDRVVSSYTPSIRALLEARKADNPQTSALERMLIVTVPDADDQPTLLSVQWARDHLPNHFPGGKHTLLDDHAATPSAVLNHLPHHRWVHFSCHGDQELADPSTGGLLLRGGVLTIADIREKQYHGDFAFLAACKTATGGVALPDETITLAAALHYAGFRHVIGTLWSVYDISALEVANAVYNDLACDSQVDPDRAANALHAAVRGMRHSYRDEPSKWLLFTHTGP